MTDREKLKKIKEIVQHWHDEIIKGDWDGTHYDLIESIMSDINKSRLGIHFNLPT